MGAVGMLWRLRMGLRVSFYPGRISIVSAKSTRKCPADHEALEHDQITSLLRLIYLVDSKNIARREWNLLR